MLITEIKVLATNVAGRTAFHYPFADTAVGAVYPAILLEAGEYDADGYQTDKLSVSFVDDAGDLALAYVDTHEGKSFEFI